MNAIHRGWFRPGKVRRAQTDGGPLVFRVTVSNRHLPSRRRYSRSGTPYERSGAASSPLRSSTVISPRADLTRPWFTSACSASRHAGAAHAQHQREELVRQRNCGAGRPIVRHENPARQPLVEMAARIADRGVRGLHQKCLHVFQQHRLQAGIFRHGGAQRIGRRCAGPLRRAACRSHLATDDFPARRRRRSCPRTRSIPPRCACRSAEPPRPRRCRTRENRRFDAPPGLFQFEAQRQAHGFEMRAQRLEIVRRKAREQTVLSGIGGHITLAHGREQSVSPSHSRPGDRGEWCAEPYAYSRQKDTLALYGTVPKLAR